jgi:ubiquinone/menaquinone biosynthesis C-methylase UbiE
MNRPPFARLLALIVALFVAAAAASSPAQDKDAKEKPKKPPAKSSVEGQRKTLEDPKRQVVVKRDEIVAACDLKPGMIVADVGAGTGVFTRLMAPKVGPQGKVLALEIKKDLVEHLEKICREQKLENVVASLSTPTSTELAAESIDLAFVSDTYHHFDHPREMLASMRSALRPEGRLVVVDFEKAGGMKDHVRTDKKTVIAEIESAGFTLVDEKDTVPEHYLLRFKKRPVRPPAVPLVVHDPYFSVWSFSDRLADDWPRHWTGTNQPMVSMVRVDGKAYRLMGKEPPGVPAMPQVGLEVLPTRTIYDFQEAGLRVRLTFTSPLLPGDLELIGRPVTYLTWEAWAIDGRLHDASIYFDVPDEFIFPWNKRPSDTEFLTRMVTQDIRVPGLHGRQIGSTLQPVLEKAGDNLRIDWGYLYVASTAKVAIASREISRNGFAADGRIPHQDPQEGYRGPVTAFAFDLDAVGAAKTSRWAMLAFDDVYSIQYLGKNLRPYWRRNGAEAKDLLQTAAQDYEALQRRCEQFDNDLMADLERVGGPRYAELCALAYRQAIGAHKLAAGPEGQPMLFPKENFSNGCIATVDVIYPAAPIFALLSNDLLKATVTPVFEYAMTPRWKFPFAPHDLGTYPKANGQVYGGGEKTEENQMPVEESGNMLILAALISQIDGNTKYVDRYWRLLERWAEYLKEKGLDPENQLCTDDFAGHLAHNANLSLKAILALGAYAKMCDMAGRKDQAAEYRGLAERFAKEWIKLADDGDHYRLAFDRPGTWSQKYNLVWDKLLGLKLFPPEVARKEMAFYKTKLNRFGLPLDNRQPYTKTDWEVWTATLAESRSDFDVLMAPVYRFVDQTPDRVPLTDWYMTGDAKLRGFRARPVIGGVFIKMLDDPAVWKKWVGKRG